LALKKARGKMKHSVKLHADERISEWAVNRRKRLTRSFAFRISERKEVFSVNRKMLLCAILALSVLVSGPAFARKKVIVVDEDKVIQIKGRGRHHDKEHGRHHDKVIIRDRRPSTLVIVERPVIVREVVERQVIVREVVETPVIVRERRRVVVSRPVVVPSVSCSTLGINVPIRIGGAHATVSFSSTSCNTQGVVVED
jgi:hypothetical protein